MLVPDDDPDGAAELVDADDATGDDDVPVDDPLVDVEELLAGGAPAACASRSNSVASGDADDEPLLAARDFLCFGARACAAVALGRGWVPAGRVVCDAAVRAAALSKSNSATNGSSLRAAAASGRSTGRFVPVTDGAGGGPGVACVVVPLGGAGDVADAELADIADGSAG